jgi:hypothetical protein
VGPGAELVDINDFAIKLSRASVELVWSVSFSEATEQAASIVKSPTNTESLLRTALSCSGRRL